MAESVRRRRTVGAAIGVLAVVAGAVVMIRPYESLSLGAALIGVCLIVTGLGELVDPDTERGWPRVGAGLTVATGLLALLLPGLTLGTLALVIGIGLVAAGAAVVLGRNRSGSVIGGIVRIVLGAVVLFWPDPTVLTTGILVGPVAVVLGIEQLVKAARRPIL